MSSIIELVIAFSFVWLWVLFVKNELLLEVLGGEGGGQSALALYVAVLFIALCSLMIKYDLVDRSLKIVGREVKRITSIKASEVEVKIDKKVSDLIDLSVAIGGVYVCFWFAESGIIKDLGVSTFQTNAMGLCLAVVVFIACSLIIKNEVIQSSIKIAISYIKGDASVKVSGVEVKNDDNKEGSNMNKYVVVGLSVSSLLLLATSFFSFGLFIKTARIQENMCWYSGLEYEVESEVSRIVDELYISEKCTDRHIKCLKSKVRNNTHFSVLESRTRNCQSDYKSREDSDLESAASEFLNRVSVKTMLNVYMNECGMEPISSDDGKSVVAGDCK
jgi:hypothetical protein